MPVNNKKEPARVLQSAERGRGGKSGVLFAAFGGVGQERLCELIGAGRILLATDALEQGDDFIGGFPFHEAADPLEISAASSNEFDIVNGIIFIDVKNDLFGTSTFC